MFWIMEIVIVFIGYYLIIGSYKSFRIKLEKLEELNGEFIFTYLSYMRKKEEYFSIYEVRDVNFSKMVIKNNSFNKLNLLISLENNDIIRLTNKRNTIIFMKSFRENTPEFYEEIFSKADIFKEISSFLGISSLREMIEKEIDEL
ncbi:MAG: hypothetical protein KBF12_08875 [Sebaldella sp.]|nr:hypothetical protein [Sebaldella sp.]